MKLKADELLDRVHVFEDSLELSSALRLISKKEFMRSNYVDHYFAKECAVHIEGLYELCLDLSKALKSCQTAQTDTQPPNNRALTPPPRKP